MIDITSELNRTYHYPDGRSCTVEAPQSLTVVEGSHRVVALDGRTYRPERGWVMISWLPREGAPAFVA